MLLTFLICDVSYCWDDLASDVVVQLRLLIFKDIWIKSSKFFVIFRIFDIIPLRIRVGHLRNGVLLDRDKRRFILRFRYRIFLHFFLGDLIIIPFWRSKPFSQLDYLLKRTLLDVFPTNLLSHALTEWLRVDFEEWIIFYLVDKLHFGSLSRIILRQLRARLVLIEDYRILVFHCFELAPFIVLFDVHVDATLSIYLDKLLL